MAGLKIHAAAHYVPPGVLTNEDIGAWVDTTDEWITKRTGIKQRYISLGENTSDLCTKVAKKLLEKAEFAPEDIEVILIATVTPDYLSPSVACMVQEAIGAKNAFAMDINAACTGFVYGMSVAQKYLASGYGNVMLIGAEVLSKYVDWKDRSTCILFGDGAGGVILSGNEDKIYVEKLRSRGSKVITVSRQEVVNAFCAGDRKMDYIKVEGREVFEFAVKSVPENIDEVLKHAKMTPDDVDYIIPHQANRRIIEGIASKMKIDISKFFINIENYGNTSSASIPIALSEMMEKGLVGEGDKIVIAGFGGGLTWGSILIEL